jgi:AcrR family transcriptional regulator
MKAKYELQEDVRQALLKSARKIFAYYGYKKTNVDEIAKAAQKGKSTFYYYYSSKEAIFKDVIEMEAQIFRTKIIASISGDEDPIQKIKKYILMRLNAFEELVVFYRALRNETLEHFSFIEDVRNKYNLEQVNIIQMILLDAVQKEQIVLDDVILAAESLGIILKGLEYHLMFSNTGKIIEEEKIDKILSMVFNGISKK